ncbi:hypothetical protein PRZ48_007976 [Zasmidium cellare]|uniref:SGNH hydrolase-type esterase domain-containing protein n=1 Tax=Zasmidium cellare TaxID=395010 RepID=A0ABR0EE72_ZASCE|nr:hypothetical protein PRZ48_007976 [Zasmidium cellare]
MRFLSLLASCICLASAKILQNGQVRITDYPDTTIPPIAGHNSSWRTYPRNARELSYKGRWDDKYISWWTAPGLKFGFQGSQVAVAFGNNTSPEVLIAYRVGGLDWQLTNVSAGTTHLLADSQATGFDAGSTQTFELRVTNWDYGVQIQNVYVANGRLVRIPDFKRRVEIVGDSLSAGQYATLEGIASYSWGLAYGLGNTEFSITAYPGMCAYDGNGGYCYGGGPRQRGQEHQWLKVSDNSERAVAMYGNNPPNYNFRAHPAADITIINLGANDSGQNVSDEQFFNAYTKLIDEIRRQWPRTQFIILNLWHFTQSGSTWVTDSPLDNVIQNVARHYNRGSLNENGGQGIVHYFNTTGILEHNDISPAGHPTDVADVKLASHLMQYIKLIFGWDLEQEGPEVQHQTTYWNDEVNY